MIYIYIYIYMKIGVNLPWKGTNMKNTISSEDYIFLIV